MSEWPPPPPRRETVPPRPWDPGSPLDPSLKDDSDRLLYIVVDEAVGESLGLSASPWPDADPEGRLRFPLLDEPLEVGATRTALRKFLSGNRQGEAAEPRIGTVFAARVKKGTAKEFFERWADRSEVELEELSDLPEWLQDPVEITEEARVVAKLAYYGALVPTLPAEFEHRWNLDRGDA